MLRSMSTTPKRDYFYDRRDRSWGDGRAGQPPIHGPKMSKQLVSARSTSIEPQDCSDDASGRDGPTDILSDIAIRIQ